MTGREVPEDAHMNASESHGRQEWRRNLLVDAGAGCRAE